MRRLTLRFALLNSRAYMGERSLEFFHVPGPLYREKGICQENTLEIRISFPRFSLLMTNIRLPLYRRFVISNLLFSLESNIVFFVFMNCNDLALIIITSFTH